MKNRRKRAKTDNEMRKRTKLEKWMKTFKKRTKTCKNRRKRAKTDGLCKNGRKRAKMDENVRKQTKTCKNG